MSNAIKGFIDLFHVRWLDHEGDSEAYSIFSDKSNVVIAVQTAWAQRDKTVESDVNSTATAAFSVSQVLESDHEVLLGVLYKSQQPEFGISSFFAAQWLPKNTQIKIRIRPVGSDGDDEPFDIILSNAPNQRPVDAEIDTLAAFTNSRSGSNFIILEEKLSADNFNEIAVGNSIKSGVWTGKTPTRIWSSARIVETGRVEVFPLRYFEGATNKYNPRIDMGPFTNPQVLDNSPLQFNYQPETPICVRIAPPIDTKDDNITPDFAAISKKILRVFLLHGQTNVISAVNSYGRNSSIALSPVASANSLYSGILILPIVSYWQDFRAQFRGIALFLNRRCGFSVGAGNNDGRLNRKEIDSQRKEIDKFVAWFADINGVVNKKLLSEWMEAWRKVVDQTDLQDRNHFILRSNLTSALDPKFEHTKLEKQLDSFIFLMLSEHLSNEIASYILTNTYDPRSNKDIVIVAERIDFYPGDVFMFKQLVTTDQLEGLHQFAPDYHSQSFRYTDTSPDTLIASNSKMFAINSKMHTSGENKLSPEVSNILVDMESSWKKIASRLSGFDIGLVKPKAVDSTVNWVDAPQFSLKFPLELQLNETEKRMEASKSRNGISSPLPGTKKDIDLARTILQTPKLSKEMRENFQQPNDTQTHDALEWVLAGLAGNPVDVPSTNPQVRANLFQKIIESEGDLAIAYKRLAIMCSKDLSPKFIFFHGPGCCD